MKIALYTRVSSSDQTVEPQLLELRAECARRGWKPVAEFTDTISGAKVTRTGLDQLMKLVRQHSIKAVACVKLDRLGRSLQHLVQIIGEFDLHGVALVCTSQGIDTSNMNPAGRLQLQILGAVAEFERSLIRERTVAGLNAARQRGARLGRPTVPLPPNHAEIVAQWRLETGGKNFRDLARRLNVNAGTAWRLAQTLAPAA
ncbi:MAG: recombinase family protein [Opitutaceae bacterium]|nr:recombinase family protein [Opitutaceae bacterium]